FELYGYAPRWAEVRAAGRNGMVVRPPVKLRYEDESAIFGSKRFRKDAKYYKYGPFIINRDLEAQSLGYTSGEQRVAYIRPRLHDTFGIDVSAFTYRQLQRVYEAEA